MCVCMYVCMYVFMYVCMYVCKYVRMRVLSVRPIRIQKGDDKHKYVCMHVCMYVYIYIYIGHKYNAHNNKTDVAHTYISTHIHAHKSVFYAPPKGGKNS